jgi:hypothetical protein
VPATALVAEDNREMAVHAVDNWDCVESGSVAFTHTIMSSIPGAFSSRPEHVLTCDILTGDSYAKQLTCSGSTDRDYRRVLPASDLLPFFSCACACDRNWWWRCGSGTCCVTRAAVPVLG